MNGTDESGFLSPWVGKLIPCNARVDCKIDDPAWRLTNAACERIEGNRSQPGYYGFCRCGTFAFRSGPLCLDRSNISELFFSVQFCLNFAKVLILLLLLRNRNALTGKGSASSFSKSNFMIILISALAILATVADAAFDYVSMLRVDKDNPRSVSEAKSSALLGSLMLFCLGILLTSWAYMITSFKLYKLLILAYTGRKELKGNFFRSCLHGILFLQVLSLLGFIPVFASGFHQSSLIMNLSITVFDTILFATIVFLIVLQMDKLTGLHRCSQVLKYRGCVAVVLNILSIGMSCFNLYGYSAPKPIDSNKVSAFYFVVAASKVATILPLIGLVYFFNGLCDLVGDMDRPATDSTRDKENSYPERLCQHTESKKQKKRKKNPKKQHLRGSSPPLCEQNEEDVLVVQDHEIDPHALTVI